MQQTKEQENKKKDKVTLESAKKLFEGEINAGIYFAHGCIRFMYQQYLGENFTNAVNRRNILTAYFNV